MVVVTGAAGFIGSHLVEQLISRTIDVVAIDDGSMGDWDNLSRVQGQFVRYDGDVFEGLSRVAELQAKGAHIEAIFHLAGRVGVEQVVADRLRVIREHQEDTVAVCTVAEETGAVVVLASSSEVYGATDKLPQCEDDGLCVGPTSCKRSVYAVSKLAAEHVALGFAEDFDVKVVIPRLFNVVGPRQRLRQGCVLPRWVTAALEGEPILIHGDGRQKRCFSHVDDVVEALITLAWCKDAYGQVVNVGQPEPMTMRAVAEDIRDFARHRYGKTSDLWFVPFDDLDSAEGWDLMLHREPSVEKLEQLANIQLELRWHAIVNDTFRYWFERQTL